VVPLNQRVHSPRGGRRVGGRVDLDATECMRGVLPYTPADAPWMGVVNEIFAASAGDVGRRHDGRGLHSFTSQLNLSALCGKGGARRVV